MKVVIFINDGGGVSIITPAPEFADQIEAVAQKDVPSGKPYKIMDSTDVPADRTLRNAWTVDVADLTDGIGGA